MTAGRLAQVLRSGGFVPAAGVARPARRAAVAAVVCALVAACATPVPVSGPSGDGVFSRTGRFAVRVDHDTGKQEAVQGGFAWREADGRLVLDLANPLGSTLARVQADGSQAVLTRSDGSQTRAATPDALVAEVLGGDIPVAGLRDWLRGRLPARPAAESVERDAAGRPVAFVQGGWRARLSRYDDQGPRLLQMDRSQAGQRISVRLVVD